MRRKIKGEKAIVIGSGIAGLAAAIRLSVMGMNVMLLEANDELGGKIAQKNKNDFRFDLGPSVLTKPEYIIELFELCNKNAYDYIQLEKLDLIFRFYFSDGSFIDSFSDHKKLLEELKKKSKESASQVFSALKDSRRIYELTHEVFLERSLHKVKNYFNWPTIRGIINFNKVRVFESMHHYNARKLSDKRLVQIFDRYASYNGSSPFEAPATLNVINHFELNEGAYIPVGGMRKLIEALHKLLKECDVEIITGVKVDEIIIEKNQVKGVLVGNKLIESEYVICNTDIHVAYQKLLPGVRKPDFILNQPSSSSVLVFLWGMNTGVPKTGLHSTFFGSDDRIEYDAVFKGMTICDDPTIYLYNSSSHFKADAPTGKANWFVMVTAPMLDGQDWESLIAKARSSIIRKLSKTLGVNIESLIETEDVLSPESIEAHTGSWKGAIYGNSSNGIFSAFLRHPNFSKKNKGLYFCGGSVHPGAGIPLCLLSAKIVGGLIEKTK